jgi:hypothetical protein
MIDANIEHLTQLYVDDTGDETLTAPVLKFLEIPKLDSSASESTG